MKYEGGRRKDECRMMNAEGGRTIRLLTVPTSTRPVWGTAGRRPLRLDRGYERYSSIASRMFANALDLACVCHVVRLLCHSVNDLHTSGPEGEKKA